MDTPHDQPQKSTPAKQPAAGNRSEGAPLLMVIKPAQGQYVRWGTVGGAGLISLAGAIYMHSQLTVFNAEWVQTVIPVVLFVAMAVVVYWIVGRNRTAVDFMIATEGEMKKVNWSTKREIIGSTKVVIFTLLALALVLFVVDILFMLIFSSIGVLQVNVLEAIFGAAGE